MKKFKYAIEGLKYALSNKAVRIQIILGVLAIIGGIIIRLDIYEWLAFVICIGLVISLEIINCVIEETCDMYNQNFDIRIKHIKDMAAAAVFTASIMALVVCAVCVLRRIF